jgi:hypothetical protein
MENIMKRVIGICFCKLAVVAVLFAMSSGCAVHHVPKPDPVEAGAIPQISGKGTISLVNAQEDKTIRDLGRAGFGTMQGDLYSWTEAAVALLGGEVEKAGLRVQSSGEKSIKVTVVEVKLGVSGIEFVAALAKGNVRIKVEAGDGYVKEYVGEKNALAPPSACEKAMTEAVMNILKDEHIVSYLSL